MNSSTGDTEAEILAYLKKTDPLVYKAALPHRGAVLSRVVPKHTNTALFQSLASSIVSQQLSIKAADSIFKRLKEVLGGAVTPEKIETTSPLVLRSAGLSESKVKSLKALTSAITSKEINLLSLKKLPPEEAVQKLTSIYGIGPWTAEMFLIFALGAPDVFSPSDLILVRRMQYLLKLPDNVSRKELARIAERWSPHRSYVSLLLWKLHSSG